MECGEKSRVGFHTTFQFSLCSEFGLRPNSEIRRLAPPAELIVSSKREAFPISEFGAAEFGAKPLPARRRLLEIGQELIVRLGLAEPIDQQLHALAGAARAEDLAEHPDLGELGGVDEQVFLAGARLLDVHGGEDALVTELAIQHDLAVARALELLEDHVSHAAASLDEGRGDDGEATAGLNVAGRAEETLGPLESVAVHAAGEHLAAGGHHR